MGKLDKNRFVALWERCLNPGLSGDAESVFQRIDQSYGARSRSYHARRHILHCLERFDLAQHLIDRVDAVEISIWFHDLVYEIGAGDNEYRSALAFRELAAGRMPADFVDMVQELIMDTLHQARPRTEEGRYVVDIDLSSFGLPWSEFRRDSDAVREESPHLTDAQFFAGQIRFLRALLDRPHFYYTEFFRSRYEILARTNIERYLSELAQAGYRAS